MDVWRYVRILFIKIFWLVILFLIIYKSCKILFLIEVVFLVIFLLVDNLFWEMEVFEISSFGLLVEY